MTLASTSHLYANGFYSNILTNQPPLSVASVEQAFQELRRQPDHVGAPMNYDGKFNLLVPPELEMLAIRIAQATRYPQSNNNDPNPAGGRIQNVIVSPWFTGTTAWMMVAAEDASNPLMYISSLGGTRTDTDYDMDKQVYKYSATRLWVKAAADGRGLIYSAGQ